MAVTVTHLAQHLDLSVSTVASILRNRGNFREETRRRVLRGAMELGYRPSAAAKTTRTGRYHAIGLLMSDVSMRSILPGTLLNAITDALNNRRLRLTIARLGDNRLVNSGAVSHLLEQWCVDGFLVNYNAYVPARMEQLIDHCGLPVIWINARQAGCCVRPDDFDGGRQAAQRLLQLGHRRLAFVDFGGGDHFSSVDRRRGAEQEARAAGAEWIVVQGEVGDPLQRIHCGSELLTRQPRPTGVIAYTPDFAWPVYRAACRLGLCLPRDLSIVTFSDLPVQLADLQMDTVLLPEARMGVMAVDLLCQMLDDNPKQRAHGQSDVAVPCTLVTGNLSAPVASAAFGD